MDCSVKLSFENQAWLHATPFLLGVLVLIGDFNSPDETVNNFYCVSNVSDIFMFFINKHLVYERSQNFECQFLKVSILIHKRDKLVNIVHLAQCLVDISFEFSTLLYKNNHEKEYLIPLVFKSRHPNFTKEYKD